jgi:DnaJ-class molecular chaperone
MFNNDYYQVLGLNQGASDEEIKRAYRRLALECHPDHHPADPDLEERFKRVTEAYSILGDADKRRAYDLRSRRAGNRDDFFDQSPEAMFWEFVQSEGFDVRKASCMGGIRGGCRRGGFAAAAAGNGSIYEVSLTPTEAALGAQKEIIVRTWGNTKTCAFRLPPGVQSGSQFRLLFDRARGLSVFVRVKIVDQNGELTPDVTQINTEGDHA